VVEIRHLVASARELNLADVPFAVHASYSREEILAAVG